MGNNDKEKTLREGGWWFLQPVKGLYPSYLGKKQRELFIVLEQKIKGKLVSIVKVQFTVSGFRLTDKKFVFIIHDDIEFYQDVLGLMINKVRSMSKPG